MFFLLSRVGWSCANWSREKEGFVLHYRVNDEVLEKIQKDQTFEDCDILMTSHKEVDKIKKLSYQTLRCQIQKSSAWFDKSNENFGWEYKDHTYMEKFMHNLSTCF